MAEKMIDEVYYYAYIVSKLRYVVQRIREGDRNHAIIMLTNILPDVEKMLSECIKDEYYESDVLKENLLSINDIQDIIFLGDMIENIAIPITERWIQTWVSIQEQVDERYIIESTSSGFLTIKDNISDKYLHSNNDPMDEARRQIEKQYQYDKDRYLVWGCGLGYQVYQLYRYSQGTIPIILYETDYNVIEYARKYGVLSWIPDDLIQIESQCKVKDFLNEEKTTDGLLFLLPCLHSISDSTEKNQLMAKYASLHHNGDIYL